MVKTLQVPSSVFKFFHLFNFHSDYYPPLPLPPPPSTTHTLTVKCNVSPGRRYSVGIAKLMNMTRVYSSVSCFSSSVAVNDTIIFRIICLCTCINVSLSPAKNCSSILPKWPHLNWIQCLSRHCDCFTQRPKILLLSFGLWWMMLLLPEN